MQKPLAPKLINCLTQTSLGKLSNRKSNETWELVQIGRRKSKKSQVSVGNSSKLGGGVFRNQKSPKFQRVSKTEKK